MTEHFLKIDENNVEVTNEVLTVESDSYGQSKIDEELEFANKELDDANNLDEVVYKQNLIDQINSKISRLNLIQTELDRGKKNNGI